MATARKPSKKSEGSTRKPRRKPATTPEEREKQLVASAMDLAEKKFRDGTASSQLICHFLKLGSSRESLEQKYLEERTKNLEAKTEAIHSEAHAEELYKNAIEAMRLYNGQEPTENIFPDD